MIFPIGATSRSLDVQFVDDAGLPLSGKVAADFPPLFYSLAGAHTDVAFPALSDLASLDSPWVAGGVKERANKRYRLDCPNAAFANEGQITVGGEETDKRVLCPAIDVGNQPTSGTGTGPTVTITVVDIVTGDPIQLATVELLINLTRYSDVTDVDGIVEFRPNEGNATYKVRINQKDYEPLAEAMLDVSGDTAPPAYELTARVVTPSDPGYVTIFGFYKAASVPVEDMVVTLQQIKAFGSGLISPSAPETTTTDATGYWEFTGVIPGAGYHISAGTPPSASVPLDVPEDATDPYEVKSFLGP